MASPGTAAQKTASNPAGVAGTDPGTGVDPFQVLAASGISSLASVGDPHALEDAASVSRAATQIPGLADGSLVVGEVHHATVEGSLAWEALGVQNLRKMKLYSEESRNTDLVATAVTAQFEVAG